MCVTLDRLFEIKSIIDNSETPITVNEIAELTDIKIRSIQRFAMRLATERMVKFRVRDTTSVGKGYEYMHINYTE